jgi:hypothetical protein
MPTEFIFLKAQRMPRIKPRMTIYGAVVGQFLLGLSVLAMAQVCAAQGFVEDPDWKELEVPPPPAFNKDKLIPVDMPSYVTLKFGVDPATLVISRDGVVRYVMVAANSSGSINAMYEGIRCVSGEFKTYARFNSSGQWTVVKDPQWRPFNDNNTSKHALALARHGVCTDRSGPAISVPAIITGLKSNPYERDRLP